MVARTIFSIANVTLAGPVVVQQRHLDVAKAAWEKWVGPDDEAADGSGSQSMPELVSDSDASRYLSGSDSPRYLSSQRIPGRIALFLLRISRADPDRPDPPPRLHRDWVRVLSKPRGRISSRFPTRRTRISHPSRRRPQDMATGLHVKDNVTVV